MSTSPTLPVSQSSEQITFDVSPPFFKDGCSLNPSTYNPSTDQVNYWQENSGNIMELYGNGFPTTCNPSPLEDIYYSLSGFITLINGNSVLIKPGGFLHQVTGDSSVTWNLDMKFESSSGTVYTFTNLKGIVGTNGLMNITRGTTSNGYGEFKQPTNEGTVQFTNLVDDAGNVFTTYDDAIKLANYDPTTGTSTAYTICSNIASTITQPGTLSGSYSNRTFNGSVTINGESTFDKCQFNGDVTITANSKFINCQFHANVTITAKSTFDSCTFNGSVTINGEFTNCTFIGNVTINGNSTFLGCSFCGNGCSFGGNVNVKIDGNGTDVTLTGINTINGTLTIEEGSTLTNSGIFSCGNMQMQINPAPPLPPAISVYGKLTNVNNRNSIIHAFPYMAYSNSQLVNGTGIELEKGGSLTNSGIICNGLTNMFGLGFPNGCPSPPNEFPPPPMGFPSPTNGVPNGLPNEFPNVFPNFLTLETDSSLSNEEFAIIKGNIMQETGSSLTNSGYINGNLYQETGSNFTQTSSGFIFGMTIAITGSSSTNSGTITESSNN